MCGNVNTLLELDDVFSLDDLVGGDLADRSGSSSHEGSEGTEGQERLGEELHLEDDTVERTDETVELMMMVDETRGGQPLLYSLEAS